GGAARVVGAATAATRRLGEPGRSYSCSYIGAMQRPASGQLPVAVLVLLAAAAGAGLVAADLGHAFGGIAVVLVVVLRGFLVCVVVAGFGMLLVRLPCLVLGDGALLCCLRRDFLFGALAPPG